MAKQTFYKISTPYGSSRFIEVYGDADMDWYSWRTVDDGRIVQDADDFYGYSVVFASAEEALRYALIAVTSPVISESDHDC